MYTYLLVSHLDDINRNIINTNINPNDDNHTPVLNGSTNTLLIYDSFGCLKTNLDLVGVGMAIKSITETLSVVKNNGEPKNIGD